MNLGPFEVGADIAGGTLVIGAVLLLSLSGNIGGDAALVAILGVGSALGVYRRRKGGNE